MSYGLLLFKGGVMGHVEIREQLSSVNLWDLGIKLRPLDLCGSPCACGAQVNYC